MLFKPSGRRIGCVVLCNLLERGGLAFIDTRGGGISIRCSLSKRCFRFMRNRSNFIHARQKEEDVSAQGIPQTAARRVEEEERTCINHLLMLVQQVE
jgi:hypothetical protein